MSQLRIDRRGLLFGVAGGLAGAALGPLAFPVMARATAPIRDLTVRSRVIEVRGRAATVFGIVDEAGRPGLDFYRSEGFHARLRNDSAEPTIIHWHGLTPPFGLDGNPLSQPPLAPGESAEYAFDLTHPGTHWMHSHFGLQEQLLLAAPLIVRDDAERGGDRQDVVMLLHDFSFTPPEEIFARHTSGQMAHVGSGSAAMEMGKVPAPVGDAAMGHAMPGMDHAAMGHAMPGMDQGAAAPGGHGMGGMDLNDVAFDAFLVNDRDLSDPAVVTVERGGRVRLRIINAAASTNFWVDLGTVTGTLVAVDGRAVQPLNGQRFEIAMAQRLDIEMDVPSEAVALPVLAQREGDRARTGLILAAPGARVERVGAEAGTVAPPVLLDLERKLVAAVPLQQMAPTRRLATDLTGSMAPYAWGLDGHGFADRVPLEVREGERVELTFVNQTMMSHPMHLHGHHFQIVGLGQTRLSGAIRDTVLVPAMENVTIAFEADNPGDWPLHCHNLYHMAAGMMTSLRYA
ncbi:multicopper oxidase family protein [Amaricoccus sp.]|uniref:multicopper oxidase family protein n=1 Tax=Amaricoccus sp. TaxID=1872485 RepID=UPI002C9D44A6|nr:multicopper oxidase family protein [Amaricoccus sp.]HRW16746.1 multicopper oxidase family protein [Amaricoccus sp.]